MRSSFQEIIIPLLFTCIFFSCRKEPVKQNKELGPESNPVIVTGTVTNITDSTAMISCNVTSRGNSDVNGIFMEFAPETFTSNLLRTERISGGGVGSFTGLIDSLDSGTQYFLRASATNLQGKANGQILSFVTPGPKSWRFSTQHHIDCMASDASNIFTGANNAWMESNDTGLTWQSVGFRGLAVKAIATQSDNILFITVGGGMWRRTSSRSLSAANTSPFFMKPNDIAASENMLVVATDSGALCLRNLAANWRMINAGLPLSGKTTPQIVKLVSSGDRVYAIVKELVGIQNNNMAYYLNENTETWIATNIEAGQNITFNSIVAAGNKLLVIKEGQHLIWTENASLQINTDFPANTPLFVHGNNSAVLCTDMKNYFAVSIDKMQTWKQIPQKHQHQLSGATFKSCFISPKFIWINTDRGVFRLEY